jgi:hypothetical protein
LVFALLCQDCPLRKIGVTTRIMSELQDQFDKGLITAEDFNARWWLQDESLEDSANLPDPDVLALEIAEELEAALEQFAAIAEDLKR